MAKRFSKPEIELARRILLYQYRLAWEKTKTDTSFVPKIPLVNGEPPWWIQAVAYADDRTVWLNGFWYPRDLLETKRE